MTTTPSDSFHGRRALPVPPVIDTASLPTAHSDGPSRSPSCQDQLSDRSTPYCTTAAGTIEAPGRHSTDSVLPGRLPTRLGDWSSRPGWLGSAAYGMARPSEGAHGA